MRVFTGIQAMRGIAALAVVFGHSVTMRTGMGISIPVANATVGIFQCGVDIFFVISGFIIASTASEIGAQDGRRGVIRFAYKRAARIYPVYWVVLAIAIVVSYWVATGPGHLTAHLNFRHVFLAQANNWFVPPAWTLFYEMNFYAAIALCILLSPKYIIELAVLGVCALAILGLSPLPRLPGVMGSPLTLEFGFGVIIAFITRRGIKQLGPICLFGSGMLFALGAYCEVMEKPVSETTRLLTFGIAAALLIYSIVAAELNGTTFSRALQYPGDISYSLYIWHFLIFTILATPAASAYLSWLPGQVQISIWIAAVVVVSAVSYEIIEKPTPRYLRWIATQMRSMRRASEIPGLTPTEALPR
jgi:exopolysaccharide production protein ExoZ